MRRETTSKVFAVGLDTATTDRVQTLFTSVHVEVLSFPSFPAVLDHIRPESRGCLLVNPDDGWGDVDDLVLGLCHRGIRMPVICLSEGGDVPAAVRALKAGALDFLEVAVNDQVLIDAVNEAFEADRATRHARQRRALLRRRFDRLTPREWDVVDPMVRGWSNREIAGQLHLSPKTVEVYRARILAKSECGCLAELIRMAIRCDLLAETSATGSFPKSDSRHAEGGMPSG